MEKLKKQASSSSWDIVLVLIIGLVVRLRMLTRDEFWFDEAFTGVLMRVSNADFIKTLSEDTNPPLFYILSKVWVAFFGTSEIGLRSISLVLGMLTIWGVYLLSKNTLNKETGVIAAFLIAVSPFLVGFSTEARAYMLYGFFIVLSIYSINKKIPWLFSLSLCAAVFTHFMAIIYIPLLCVYFIWKLRAQKAKFLNILFVIPPVISFFWAYIQTTAKAERFNDEWIDEAKFTYIIKSITAYLYGVQVKLTGENELNVVNLILDEKILGKLFFAGFIALLGYFLYRIRKHQTKINKEQLEAFLFYNVLVFFPQIALILLSRFTEHDLYVDRYLFPSAIFFLISVAFLVQKILSFEILVMLLMFYIFTLAKIQHPQYYNGMEKLADTYRTSEKAIVFTSPVDYLVGRYYFGENFINIRIFDPKNPDETYWWWPLVRENAHTNGNPRELRDSLVVSPNQLNPEEYIQVNGFESYSVYVRKQ